MEKKRVHFNQKQKEGEKVTNNCLVWIEGSFQ